MQTYRSKYYGILFVLAALLPFFDWTENLVSVGGLFYLNIYKLFFLITILHISSQKSALNFRILLRSSLIILFSVFFIIFHGTFENLKGFFFVSSLLILTVSLQGTRAKIGVEVLALFKILLVLILMLTVLEVVMDEKFITPDFRDNHRQLLGISVRRASLSFQDPNYLAFHTGILFLMLRHFSKKRELFYLVAVAIVLFLTGSRGALLAFFGAIAYEKYDFKLLKPFIALTLILGLGYLLVNISIYTKDLPEMYLNASVDARTVVTRLILWTSAVFTLFAHPVFGLGHGVISTYGKTEYLPFQLPTDVELIIDEMGFHNYWLELAVENGLFISGLIIYFLLRKFKVNRSVVLFTSAFLFTSGYESPFLMLIFIL